MRRLSNIVFLHQTTTQYILLRHPLCCQISSFYIKPQPNTYSCVIHSVVKYRLSTSNHNHILCLLLLFLVVKYRLSTSNHNNSLKSSSNTSVVKYRLSTSNHNFTVVKIVVKMLSNIVFLHQTTTSSSLGSHQRSCQISSFYIKPQPYQ